MASAIAQHLDQFQAESNQSNDFHSRRATVDYIPKSHSKLPFLYAPVSWDMVDSDQYRELSGEAVKLYVYLSRHVDLRIKQKTRGNREYLMGRTFAKKYDTIVEECYGGRRSIRSIQRYTAELEKANLIEVDKGWGNVCTFTLMAYHQTDKIEEYETNAVQREFEIQQAALKNNKLRLLRHEKEEVIEVEAPQVMAEPIAETAVDVPDTTTVSTPIPKETYLTETSSSNSPIPAQLEFDSSSSQADNYDQLKLQTLELWCQQQHKLGNLAPSAGDRYQIMRPDHQLGIDAFVADTIRFSPNLTPTQALNLLQSCIKIMPKTGGNSRPVGRPGWFLLSASDQYFKRAWANTFDFLPPHWHNQQPSSSRRAFNRSKPRASHF